MTNSNKKTKSFATDKAISRIQTILNEHQRIRFSILNSKDIRKDSQFYVSMHEMIEIVFKYNETIGMEVDDKMKSNLWDYPWKRPYFSCFSFRNSGYKTYVKNIDFNWLDDITEKYNTLASYKPRKADTKKAKRDNIKALLNEFSKVVEKPVEDLFVEEYIKKITSGNISKTEWTKSDGQPFEFTPPNINWLDKVLDGIEQEIEENPEIVDMDFGLYFGQSMIKWFGSQDNIQKYKFIDPLLKYVGRKVGNNETEIVVHKTEKHGEEIKSTNISSIRFGSEIEHILKHQLAAKRNPKLNKLFKLAFVERKLLELDYQVKKVYTPIEQKEVIKEECELEGNFILCLDTSCSITDKQMEIIKSISCAMTLDAMKRNRKCYIIEFSDNVSEFNAADPSCIDKFLAFLNESDRGGTNMVAAVDRGLNIMKEENFSLSDILIISDFEIYPFSDSMIKKVNKQRQKGNRVFGLCLTKDKNDSYYWSIMDNIKRWINDFWVYIESERNDGEIANQINELINLEKNTLNKK